MFTWICSLVWSWFNVNTCAVVLFCNHELSQSFPQSVLCCVSWMQSLTTRTRGLSSFMGPWEETDAALSGPVRYPDRKQLEGCCHWTQAGALWVPVSHTETMIYGPIAIIAETRWREMFKCFSVFDSCVQFRSTWKSLSAVDSVQPHKHTHSLFELSAYFYHCLLFIILPLFEDMGLFDISGAMAFQSKIPDQ